MSLYTTQKQTHRQRKQMYGYQRGKWVGRIYESEINMNQKKNPEAVFNKGLPLQYSCLENPRDGGAWWAAIYGVAQSWTWLKRLGSSNWVYIWHEEIVKIKIKSVKWKATICLFCLF